MLIEFISEPALLPNMKSACPQTFIPVSVNPEMSNISPAVDFDTVVFGWK